MSYRPKFRLGRPTFRETLGAMTRGERLVFWVNVGNWAVLILQNMYLGGDALHGFVRNGRYFVGEHLHYHEVGRTTFILSAVQCLSLIISNILSGIFMFRAERRA
jgi:hypothetical protein